MTTSSVFVALIAAAAVLQTAPPASVPGMTWARIPAGSFQMGCVPGDERCNVDEYPRHAVAISKAFDMMTTEVTIGTYKTSRLIEPQPLGATDDHPVVIVTWDQARTFCQSVGGRLPTEAEWEYAARGGREGGIYPWGNEPPAYAPHTGNGAAFESDRAQPVKSYGPNGYGLFDMAGNVWEWTEDTGSFYPSELVTDPQGNATGLTRIARGGSFGDDASNLRVSNRTPNQPGRVNVNVGFRCARDVTP